MAVRLETFAGSSSDALRGRAGGGKVGILGFDGLEAVHETIELGVGNLRRVENVVEVLVLANLLAEFFDFASDGCGGGHQDFTGSREFREMTDANRKSVQKFTIRK